MEARTEPADRPVELDQYLAFQAAGELFAFPVLEVREILPFERLTRIPHAPRAVRGVISVRGNVTPVVDLAVRFGEQESEVGKRSCVIIVEVPQPDGELAPIGLLAQAVRQVVDLAPGQVEPPAAAIKRSPYLRGIGRLGDELLLILDVRRTLSVDGLDALDLGAAPAQG